MKRKRNILFRVIFLLALLVNSGVVVYSSFILNSNSIELTSNENSVEPGFSTANNFAFDDLTDQFYTFGLTDLPESHLLAPEGCSIVHNFCISVWHPPKIL
jgi:hypothetical protein